MMLDVDIILGFTRRTPVSIILILDNSRNRFLIYPTRIPPVLHLVIIVSLSPRSRLIIYII